MRSAFLVFDLGRKESRARDLVAILFLKKLADTVNEP